MQYERRQRRKREKEKRKNIQWNEGWKKSNGKKLLGLKWKGEEMRGERGGRGNESQRVNKKLLFIHVEILFTIAIYTT